MKKQMMIATGLALLSTGAHATKARMEALGQDGARGSFFIDDTRNVFHNPAHLAETKNYVVAEWGNDGIADTAAGPQAEGGFFREFGNFAYGVYLGSDNSHNNNLRTAVNNGTLANQNTFAFTNAAGEAGFLSRDNDLNLFFSGDMGVQWGVRLNYSSNKDEAGQAFKKEQDAFGLALGIVMGGLDVYVNLDISDESKGGNAADDKWDADTGVFAGINYTWNEWTPFFNISTSGSEYTNSGVTQKVEYSASQWQLGFGHTHELSSSVRIYTSLAYVGEKAESKTATTEEIKASRLPLTVGFEADATSWLVLRGSVGQNVFINNVEASGFTGANANGKESLLNTTDIAMGATLNFGKLKLDGLIGNTGGARNGANFANAAGETGVLTTDNLMTRVSIHYWF